MSSQVTIDTMREALRDIARSRQGGQPTQPATEPTANVNPAATTATEPATANGVLAPDARRDFIFAGKAIFTIQSPSGTRFTFKVTKKQDEDKPPIWFVFVLTGSDNVTNYSYIGAVFATGFRTTRGSKLALDAPSVRAFAWFSVRLTDPRITVWHEGRCGRCARLLTVPSSIERGIGPDCATKD